LVLWLKDNINCFYYNFVFVILNRRYSAVCWADLR